MATRTAEELLAGVPLFAGLSKKDLSEVSSLATRLNLGAGAELMHQEAIGREFIIVLDGIVDVLIDGEVVATCGAGSFFGEIALLEDRQRVATVVAKTDVVVDVISPSEFSTLLADHPSIGDELRAAMTERLAENAARGGEVGATKP